jgi:7,8-dihydropterin-6-yl-methyl-4-(beta-D-ribofuranosyl)aminobenzene 5'-phosphate synthase
VTAHLDGKKRRVLFDAGPDPHALERNGQRMALDFRLIEALVLSHGHFDHSGGLVKALDLIRAGDDGRTVPLHVHPGAFVRRAVRLPSGDVLPLQEVPSPATLEAHGASVLTSTEAEKLLDGFFSLSGEIPRTSFERGMTDHLRATATGGWEPGPLIEDERFMAAHVRGKGIVVFTGCSHAGIVNICRHAQELFPDVPLYALVGGFHLVGPNEDVIAETLVELRGFHVKAFLAGHCTGWRAIHALVGAFGEAAVDPLAVGTRQIL